MSDLERTVAEVRAALAKATKGPWLDTNIESCVDINGHAHRVYTIASSDVGVALVILPEEDDTRKRRQERRGSRRRRTREQFRQIDSTDRPGRPTRTGTTSAALARCCPFN